MNIDKIELERRKKIEDCVFEQPCGKQGCFFIKKRDNRDKQNI